MGGWGGVSPRHAYDEETVLVGRSGGAVLLLAILERLDVLVPQAFLVRGWDLLA